MQNFLFKPHQGLIQDSMIGEAEYLKYKIVPYERRRHEAMFGGFGGMLPQIFFE